MIKNKSELNKQIPLEIGHDIAMGRDDFLISQGSLISRGNAEAVAWIDKWPNWSSSALVIYGPESCGKTHLLHVWKERVEEEAQIDVLLIQARELTRKFIESIIDEIQYIAVDDIEKAFGNPDLEQNLFHLYNILKERQGYLLLSSSQKQVDWDIGLADLSSRLRSVTAVEICPPEEDLLMAVLVKLFSDRQIRINHDVVAFVITRVPRSFALINDIVDKVDKAALSMKRPVSVPLVRDVMKEMLLI